MSWAAAQAQVAAPASAGTAAPSAAEPRWADMPWHLVDLYWDVVAPAPCASYSMDVVLEDLEPGAAFLYLAAAGGVETLNGQAFYGGLQTHADGGDRRQTFYREIGPAFIFSRWGWREMSAARLSADGFCQSSGHEGDFLSVRARYAWHPGRYTFTWIALDREVADGQPRTWVGLFVRDHGADAERYVGALLFPGDGLHLTPPLTSFVEVYGPRRPVSDIPEFRVRFENPRADGRPLPIRSVSAQFNSGVPGVVTVEPAGDRGVQIRVQGPAAVREPGLVRVLPVPPAPAP